eukprot:CAMPEP_0178500458 /NCGR_PEP_ID=MMETSP0696-20121128/16397_1 /TAXON_ID=265572 /ORGANISM="Extubocellulus spinifer, Strain CCMP396" /LENGTH=500 /DNA_ID=CAMNT_0020129281 /DNA_START=250 /DNA_END=1749 /DNA_ORIENTATION=-
MSLVVDDATSPGLPVDTGRKRGHEGGGIVDVRELSSIKKIKPIESADAHESSAKKVKQTETSSSWSARPSDGDVRIVDESSQVKGIRTGHVLLLDPADAGNTYVNGKFSSRISSLLQENSLAPLFGYDFFLVSGDAEVPIDAVKTEVGKLIMEVLMDGSQQHRDVAGRLLRRLMYGNDDVGRGSSVVVARNVSCIESEALSDVRYGDPVGIAAKALATKFSTMFPGKEKYPCVVEDINYVLKNIGHDRRGDLVAVSTMAMMVLMRGGYLHLKRTDVSMWFKKSNCYRTLASDAGIYEATESVLCDSGLCSLQRRWSIQKEEKVTRNTDGIVLYLKAGPHGEGVGDCPFGQYARIVLEEKEVPYELKPCTLYNKPQWLIEDHDGSMPALRHGDQSYVESEVVAQYIDYFFSEASLSTYEMKDIRAAKDASNAIFPALARYLTHLPDGNEDDAKLRSNLEKALQRLEDYLSHRNVSGPYLVGDGEQYSLVDASLTPKLYHMW